MTSNGMDTLLPDGWRIKTLREVGTWRGGGTPSKANPAFWTGGSIPWISPKDMKVDRIRDTEDHITEDAVASSATTLIPAQSVVVVSRSGILQRVLPVALTEVDATLNQDMKALTPSNELLPLFATHYLRSEGRSILDTCSKDGTTVASLDFQRLLAFPIPIPPLAEQHRIVAAIETHLTRLDAAVAALERARARLKRYRAAVLKAACEGRLVPTEAHLARTEGRPYEPAPALLARIQEQRAAVGPHGHAPTRRKRLIDVSHHDLLPLPEGWVWARWGDIGSSQNGRAFPSAEYQDSGVRLLRPGNLHDDGTLHWTESNTRHMDESWMKEHPDFVVRENELVMNLTAQSLKDDFLGRTCLTAQGERCLLNQRLARLSPTHTLPSYLLCLFKSSVFRRFVDRLNTGSLIQHMFTSQLDEFMLPLPPLAEQERIVAEVDRRLSVLDQLDAAVTSNLKRADALRQSVLRRAFAGQLVDEEHGLRASRSSATSWGARKLDLN